MSKISSKLLSALMFFPDCIFHGLSSNDAIDWIRTPIRHFWNKFTILLTIGLINSDTHVRILKKSENWNPKSRVKSRRKVESRLDEKTLCARLAVN